MIPDLVGLIVDRGPELPAGAAAYRRIGPFDAEAIPFGLLGEHRLKAGAWGLLEVVSGSIRFVWSDSGGGARELVAPAKLLVPPEVPHHLERTGPVSLQITFCRAP